MKDAKAGLFEEFYRKAESKTHEVEDGVVVACLAA